MKDFGFNLKVVEKGRKKAIIISHNFSSFSVFEGFAGLATKTTQ